MKFSIITATKNNKTGLLRAIECVRNQTYKNVEHIIVDGGSTDGSAEAIRNLQLTMNNSGRTSVILNEMKDLHSAIDFSPAAQNDPLHTTNYSLLAISEADSGIYDAINKGIKLATGDVIGLLHSDDLFADENVLEKVAEVFKSRAESKEQSRKAQSDNESIVILNEMNDLLSAADSSPAAQNDGGRIESISITGQPSTFAMTERIEAVYSDLVYVRNKSKVKKPVPNWMRDQKSKVESGNADSGSEAGMTKQSTTYYSLLTTSYSVIRYWKTQKEEFTTETQRHRVLQNGWMPPHPTLFIRREIFEKYGFYNTELRIASDYEMILRLLFKNQITSYYLPITTYLMSIGGASNKSLKNILQKSKEDYRAMKMNGINFPFFTLVCKNFRKLPQFLAHDLS